MEVPPLLLVSPQPGRKNYAPPPPPQGGWGWARAGNEQGAHSRHHKTWLQKRVVLLSWGVDVGGGWHRLIFKAQEGTGGLPPTRGWG